MPHDLALMARAIGALDRLDPEGERPAAMDLS
jgi:hypothetical protein